MEPKKYPHKNLNNKKLIFFQVGLIAVLLLVLISVEWKTETQLLASNDQVTYQFLQVEEMPNVTLPEKVLEPIKRPKPDIDDFIIDEKDPESKTEEKPIQEKTTPILGLLDFDDFEPVEDEPIKEIGFEFIEDVPIFPGCEQYTDNTERKACMSEQLKAFINKEFDTGLATDLGLTGINRIYTSFKIKANGEAEFINARASHPKLKEESRRVIEKLPKMQPGKQRGKPVDVIFALPITFKVSD
jgi:protein TonB